MLTKHHELAAIQAAVVRRRHRILGMDTAFRHNHHPIRVAQAQATVAQDMVQGTVQAGMVKAGMTKAYMILAMVQAILDIQAAQTSIPDTNQMYS